MSIEVIGGKKVIRAFKKLNSGTSRSMKGTVFKLGHKVRNKWMGKIKEMDIYDEGHYHRSIEVRQEGHEVEIGTDLDYPVHHEYGTRNLRSRPAMRMTALEMEKEIDREINKVIDGELKKI